MARRRLSRHQLNPGTYTTRLRLQNHQSPRYYWLYHLHINIHAPAPKQSRMFMCLVRDVVSYIYVYVYIYPSAALGLCMGGSKKHIEAAWQLENVLECRYYLIFFFLIFFFQRTFINAHQLFVHLFIIFNYKLL